MRSNEALCCTVCMASLALSTEGLVCPQCDVLFPEREGIFDFLQSPTKEVSTELSGLASENNIELEDGFGAVKFMLRPPEPVGQLMERSRRDQSQYYQVTTSAYLEALSRAQIDGGLDVLEIGSDRTHHKLRIIRDLCASAYALNIFYQVPQDPDSADFVTRVLADMSSRLPFKNESLDLVVVSAALHHAPNLEEALREIARILRPKGRAVVVNEPVEGAIKRYGSRRHHNRNHLIKEEPVTWATWTRAIAASGLRPDHFLPEWFIGRIRESSDLPKRTRFHALGSAVGAAVSIPGLGGTIRLVGRIPGQRLLGLPLNAVLWKS